MVKQTYPKGLDPRQRGPDGAIRRPRSDPPVGALRAEYGTDFLPGYGATPELRPVLRKEGAESLRALLRRKRRGA